MFMGVLFDLLDILGARAERVPERFAGERFGGTGDVLVQSGQGAARPKTQCDLDALVWIGRASGLQVGGGSFMTARQHDGACAFSRHTFFAVLLFACHEESL